MVYRRSIDPKVVIVQEAEAMFKFGPIDSQPLNVNGFACRICLLEPYVFVEFLVWDLVFGNQLPRNLNETRLGFIHGEEDGIEGVGTSCLDLEAVLFVRSPVLFTMLFVTIRSRFAARTHLRSRSAAHKATSRCHCEGLTAGSKQ